MFVDASWHPETKAAGWGAWMVSDAWPRGQFDEGEIILKKRKCHSATVAEMAGIGLAVWNAHRRGDLEPVTELMIQCDCLAALQYIRCGLNAEQGKGLRISPLMWGSIIVGDIIETLKIVLEGKRIIVKHVKGHQESNTGRAWVNNQCDAAAKRNMRSMRARILSTNLQLP